MPLIISTILPLLKAVFLQVGAQFAGDALMTAIKDTIVGALGGTIANTVAPVITDTMSMIKSAIFGEDNSKDNENNKCCGSTESSENNEGTKTELISPDILNELNTNFDLLKEKLVGVSETLKSISDEMQTLSPKMIGTFVISALAAGALIGVLTLLSATILRAAVPVGLLALLFVGLSGVISLMTLPVGLLILLFAGLSGVISLITLSLNGLAKAIDGFGTKATSGIKNTMDSIAEKVTNAFNIISRLFAKVLKPNIKMPKIEITGKFSLNPLQVPKFGIGWYQTGGIFTGPSVIGVGEAGDEAVLPLSNKRRMKPFANAVASMMSLDTTSGSTDNKGVTINIDNMSVRNDMDIKKIANEINRLVARENRKLGII